MSLPAHEPGAARSWRPSIAAPQGDWTKSWTTFCSKGGEMTKLIN